MAAALCIGLASSCTTSSSSKPEKLRAPIKAWADIWLSRNLAELLDRIERGDAQAWNTFAAYATDHLDGEHSETYSMACAELARRDPTLCLRKHLMGDSRAVVVGKRAYGWIGTQGRHVMDWLHESRLQLATSDSEKRRIQEYVTALHSVLASIEKKYR